MRDQHLRMVAVAICTLAAGLAAMGQAGAPAQSAVQGFGICRPASQRTGDEDGCWIITDQRLGKMPAAEMYWFVDQFAGQQEAEQAKTQQSTVLEADGKWWLLTIAKTKRWKPGPSARRRAIVGPLPVSEGEEYSALFMDTKMEPGVTSAIHRHSGPEAWFTMTGETCLETPDGKVVDKPGGSRVIVSEGTMMRLTAVGKEKRRGFTLILHRTVERPTTIVTEWKPKGLCK